MTMARQKVCLPKLVIIPGWSKPVARAIREELARRMMYVAMTRARRTLILDACMHANGRTELSWAPAWAAATSASQFLEEIGIRRSMAKPLQTPLAQSWLLFFGETGTRHQHRGPQELIKEALSDKELTIFCYDHFRDVYHQSGTGMSKTVKIQRLIEYCVIQVEAPRLLYLLRAENPEQFPRFEERLHT